MMKKSVRYVAPFLLLFSGFASAQVVEEKPRLLDLDRFHGAITYNSGGMFNAGSDRFARYHFYMNDIHGALLYRVNPALSVGLVAGTGFSFSSHDEYYKLQRIGLRGEYRLFAQNPEMRKKLPLHISTEVQSNYMWNRRATGFDAENKATGYRESRARWHSMPVMVGAEFLLNPNRNKKINIFWTPEVGYAVPLGPQASTPFQQSLVLNLLRFKLTFGK